MNTLIKNVFRVRFSTCKETLLKYITLLPWLCYIYWLIHFKEHPAWVSKESCSIFQEESFISDSSSKSNIGWTTELKNVRINNINDIIIGTLNINSLVSKFDERKIIGQDIFDILIVNDTKLDASFPVAQFCINGFFTKYRLDRN